MSFSVVTNLDTLRTLAHGSISGSYAAVGSPLAYTCRLICFTNNTDGDMFFSNDGVNNKLFVAASSFKLFDLTSNRSTIGNQWVLPIGTQFYVAQSTMPSKGAVYIEVLY